ncbi:hypothetical protein Vretimale_11461, partial [Volvox reticuliferus]
MDRPQKSHLVPNHLLADKPPKAATATVLGPTDAYVASQPTTPTGTTAPALHPSRASLTSFPLSPPSTGVSDSYSRRDSLSYSPLLRETLRSPQQLGDREFTAAPAVPNDTFVPILEGSPIGSISEGNPPPPPLLPPPQQPQQQKLRQPSGGPGAHAATEPFKGFQIRDPLQSQPVVDPVGLYGVYDPSGAVEYLRSSPLIGEEQEEEEYYEDAEQLSVTFATTVTATFGVPEEEVAEVAALAEGALLSTAFAGAAALAAGGEPIPDDLVATAAAALLSLQGLTTAPAEERSAAAAAEALTDPSSSAQRIPTRAVHQPATTTATSMAAKEYAAAAAAVAAAPFLPSLSLSQPEWHDCAALPPRYKTTVEALKSLAAARLMEQHWDAAEHLDIEVLWDAPPVYLQGREPMRIAVWLAKWAAVVSLEPMMVKLLELDDRRSRLEMVVQARVMPHRPWWLPATWLLRKEYQLTGTVRLHISKGPKEDGSMDVVTFIDGSLHNMPKLPTALRTLVAIVMGYIPAATESYWSTFIGLLGDPSYRRRAEEHPTVAHKATTAAQEAAAAAAERTHR